MNLISFCYDEDYYDHISVLEENCYYEKTSNIEWLHYYLTIDIIDLSLIHEIQHYINKKINRSIRQSNTIRAPYDKNNLISEAIYYDENKSCACILLSKKLFLYLKTMDGIYTI